MDRRRAVRRLRCLGLAGGLAFLRPAAAEACAVCYGMAEGDMIDGARMAIVFMLGLTYLLLGGAVGMVWIARRRVVAGAGPERDDAHNGKDDRE